jgi:hypothetical protein
VYGDAAKADKCQAKQASTAFEAQKLAQISHRQITSRRLPARFTATGVVRLC